MARTDALWPFGELRRELAIADATAAALERQLARIATADAFDVERARGLCDELGKRLVSAGADLGKVERALSTMR